MFHITGSTNGGAHP